MKPEWRNRLVVWALIIGGALAPCLLSQIGGAGIFGWDNAADNHPERIAPFQTTALWLQWLVVICAFGIKPMYMLLSLVLIVWLWKTTAPDLSALKWGLIAFLAGEAFCAFNYLVCSADSELFEFLHSYGMAVCFGFTAYAMLEGLDRRLIKFSPPTERCAVLSLCRVCFKYANVPCGLMRVFMALTPALAILALMPLCSSPKQVAYRTNILGGAYTYSHPLVYQLFEIRFCPMAAAIMLFASWMLLLSKSHNPVPLAKILFAAGLGPLGFGFLRWVLFVPYLDNLTWFESWEEITELIFITGVALVLWLFRRGLFEARTKLVST